MACYVAKPAVVSEPSIPPGWSDNWPRPGDTGGDPDPFFPAPFPPGYAPEYSLALTVPAKMEFDGIASIVGSLRDHDDYATNEPDAIIWAATIEGNAVNLRFSGDEEYVSNISSDCIWGTYWGATPDIEFELTEGNIGDIITVRATSAITGNVITETAVIEIALLPISASLVVSWGVPVSPYVFPGPFPRYLFQVRVEIVKNIPALTRIALTTAWYKQTSNDGDPQYGWLTSAFSDENSSAVVSNSETTIEISDLSLTGNVKVRITFAAYDLVEATMFESNAGTAELEVERDEAVIDSGSLSLEIAKSPYVPSDTRIPWVTINSESGEVTVVNP